LSCELSCSCLVVVLYLSCESAGYPGNEECQAPQGALRQRLARPVVSISAMFFSSFALHPVSLGLPVFICFLSCLDLRVRVCVCARAFDCVCVCLSVCVLFPFVKAFCFQHSGGFMNYFWSPEPHFFHETRSCRLLLTESFSQMLAAQGGAGNAGRLFVVLLGWVRRPPHPQFQC
jgi:hypothetical protein